MKRSEVNALLEDAKQFFREMNFALPPWAFWSPEQWKGLGHTEVVRHELGWDLTDYGKGDFVNEGLLLFTIRNGKTGPESTKPYAEKIMISREGQVCSMHFHWTKVEDIINRGGGNLQIELHGSDENEDFSDQPITVSIDGMERTVDPGTVVTLTPGESITLRQGMYHKFWGEPGRGRVMIGEVSTVNDDHTDNRFHKPQARFPEIEEDEAPVHLLVGDYRKYI